MSEIIYLSLGEGLSAKVEIQMIQEPALPTPNEPVTRRAPTVRELHEVAELMLRRVYNFHPITD
jgi:hypothetical protein